MSVNRRDIDDRVSFVGDEGSTSRHQTSLAAVRRDAASAWNTLPDDWKVDKEFILAAVKHSSTLPDKSHFERTWPQATRFDRDVVLAFCGRDDFTELFKDRHLFVPGGLINDKEVMLAYCSQIPRSLQECSDALIDDGDIVRAAISLDGIELQYASLRLQADESIVRAACAKNGRALEFCPLGALRHRLLADRDFMLQVVRCNGGPMMKWARAPLDQDRDLLMEAIMHGLSFRHVPLHLQHNVDFVCEALSKNALLFMELPKTLQLGLRLARAAALSPTTTKAVLSLAVNRVPGLKEERGVVLAWTLNGAADQIVPLMQAQPQWLGDKELILSALDRAPWVYHYVIGELKQDVDVVLAAIQSGTAVDVFRSMRSAALDFLLEHPAVAVKAIEQVPHADGHRIRTIMPGELWTNRDVIRAAIRRAWRLQEQSVPVVKDDRELALEVAEFNFRDFGRISSTLREDQGFMQLAVERDGRVLRFGSQGVRSSPDVAVRAWANHGDAFTMLPAGSISKNAVTQYVQERLDLHQMFLDTFLRGIAVSTPHQPPAHRSALPLLDRGVETSVAFKHLIADYVGVPMGAEYARLRQAQTRAHSRNELTGESLTQLHELMMENATLDGELHGFDDEFDFVIDGAFLGREEMAIDAANAIAAVEARRAALPAAVAPAGAAGVARRVRPRFFYLAQWRTRHSAWPLDNVARRLPPPLPPAARGDRLPGLAAERMARPDRALYGEEWADDDSILENNAVELQGAVIDDDNSVDDDASLFGVAEEWEMLMANDADF